MTLSTVSAAPTTIAAASQIYAYKTRSPANLKNPLFFRPLTKTTTTSFPTLTLRSPVTARKPIVSHVISSSSSSSSSSSDTEVVLHLIAESKQKTFLERVVQACEKLKGTYAMVFLGEGKLVVVRDDPFGSTQLRNGQTKEWRNGVASDKDSERSSSCLVPNLEPRLCVVDLIRSLFPNSMVFGRSVYKWRKRLGEVLAAEYWVDCQGNVLYM